MGGALLDRSGVPGIPWSHIGLWALEASWITVLNTQYRRFRVHEMAGPYPHLVPSCWLHIYVLDSLTIAIYSNINIIHLKIEV